MYVDVFLLPVGCTCFCNFSLWQCCVIGIGNGDGSDLSLELRLDGLPIFECSVAGSINCEVMVNSFHTEHHVFFSLSKYGLFWKKGDKCVLTYLFKSIFCCFPLVLNDS